MVRPPFHKTTYEFYHVKILLTSLLKVFGSTCYILNTKNQLNKYDFKNQNGIFLLYSLSGSLYRVYTLKTNCVEESFDVVFGEVKAIKEGEIDYDEEKECNKPP